MDEKQQVKKDLEQIRRIIHHLQRVQRRVKGAQLDSMGAIDFLQKAQVHLRNIVNVKVDNNQSQYVGVVE